MSDSNLMDNQGLWPLPDQNSDGSNEHSRDILKYPSRMPGVVVYTTGHASRSSGKREGEVDEQIELSAALDVALNAVRKVRNKSSADRVLQQAVQNEVMVDNALGTSNVIPIGEMPLVVGESIPEELSNDPAPVGPFAPINDFPNEGGNGHLADAYDDDPYDDEYDEEVHYSENEAVSSVLRGMSEIPQSIQAQTNRSHAANNHEQFAQGGYDPQVAVRRFRGASLATGFAATVVAGFFGIYVYNSPAAIMTNLNFPGIFGAALGPSPDATAPVTGPALANNNAPNSAQPLIAAVPVTSVAVRANPHLTVEPAGGESGTDIPLTIGIDPVPGGNTSVVVNGLPDGASLTAGVESTKGVWIVKPVDLDTLALRTPLGISGQYDFDVELISADGKTMDRKDFQVVLSAEPSTVAVIAAPQPEPDRPLPVQGGTEAPKAAPGVANAYASQASNNPAFIASGLSLFDFQERAKFNGQMIARGDTLISNGDISSARLLYERAGKDGSAVGATLAAMTYDPISLKEHPNNTMRPNAGKAQIWYAKAIGLGSKEAKTRRAVLDTFLASN